MDNLTDRRDYFIDFAKGISILLVLWGHCIQYMSAGTVDFFEDNAFKVIYSFPMPLFMLLSGYVSYWGCNKKLKIIITNRLRGVGIPLFVWGTLDFVIASILVGTFNVRTWFHSIIGIWFLWAVLCASIFVAVIHKLPVSTFLKYLIMILGTILFVQMPGGTSNGFVYPYFVIGYAINEWNLFENETYRKVIQPICGVIWVILLLFYKKESYIYISGLTWKISEIGLLGQISIDLYRYTIGLVGSLAVIGLLKKLYDKVIQKDCKQSKPIAKVLHIIQRLGLHTLEIYVLQRIVLERCFAKAYEYTINFIGQNILALNRALYDLCFTLWCAVVIGIVLMKFSEAASKHPRLSFSIFGKHLASN